MGEVALEKHDSDGDSNNDDNDGSAATKHPNTKFGMTAKTRMATDDGEGGGEGDEGDSMTAKVEEKVARAKTNSGEGRWGWGGRALSSSDRAFLLSSMLAEERKGLKDVGEARMDGDKDFSGVEELDEVG